MRQTDARHSQTGALLVRGRRLTRRRLLNLQEGGHQHV
jgi:hypothetical protein